MNNDQTKLVFAVQTFDNEICVSITEHEYWLTEKRLQDSYDDETCEAIYSIMEGLELEESSKSVFIYEGPLTAITLNQQLETHPSFVSDENFKEFISIKLS